MIMVHTTHFTSQAMNGIADTTKVPHRDVGLSSYKYGDINDGLKLVQGSDMKH